MPWAPQAPSPHVPQTHQFRSCLGGLCTLWRTRFIISLWLAPSYLPTVPFHRGPYAFLTGLKFGPLPLYPPSFSIALIVMIPCIFYLSVAPKLECFSLFVLHREPWPVPDDNKHYVNKCTLWSYDPIHHSFPLIFSILQHRILHWGEPTCLKYQAFSSLAFTWAVPPSWP